MKVIMNGALGKMGSVIWKLLEEGKNGMEIACGVDPNADGSDARIVKTLSEYQGEADVIIDFSFHGCIGELMDYAVSRQIPCVVATTGHTAAELDIMKKASEKVAVFHSANMSVGIAVLADFAKRAAALMPEADIEIVEKHHNQKVDAPSGTALMLADAVKSVDNEKYYTYGRNGIVGKRDKNEIGIHAVRGGGIVGEHQVIFASNFETITLTHQATDRSVFADGAVKAAQFIVNMPNGLYNMSDVINQK